MGKEILFGLEARGSMQAGLNKLANAVKVTLGPRGRHAAIRISSSGQHYGWRAGDLRLELRPDGGR